MSERKKNTSAPIDFVARAEQIIHSSVQKEKKKSIRKVDRVVNSMILSCCFILSGLLVYLML